MKTIELTAEQKKEIERRRKGTLDRRVYQRLTAILAVGAGKTREETAALLGVGLTQLGEWLRVFRNAGLDALCAIHHRGDPGKLTPQQVEQLKAKVSTGCFRNSDQIRDWIQSTFAVSYSSSGVKDLLKRVGVSFHKVTGFLWKGTRISSAPSSSGWRGTSARRSGQAPHGPGATTSMPATRCGGWTWCSAAGCC